MKFKKARYSHGSISGDIYFDKERSDFRGTFVALIGFPSFAGPNVFYEEVASQGFLVVQPHYPGTYDSEGEFTPKSFSETFEHLNQVISQGIIRGDSVLAVPQNNIILSGHSFGCAVLLRGASFFKYRASAVFIGPAAHYRRENPDFGLLEDGIEHFSAVRKTHPFTYRIGPEKDWLEILNGQDEIPQNPQTNKIEKAIIVVGSEDTYCDKTTCKENLPGLIRNYFGKDCDVTWKDVKGAGHPISDLVGRSDFKISEFLNSMSLDHE